MRAVFCVGSLVVLAVDMEFCLNNQGVCPMYLALCWTNTALSKTIETHY